MSSASFSFFYYLLSFTWGLPANAAGALISLIMLISGHRPKKFCGSIYFECGKKYFGGFSYGIFFIKDRSENLQLMCHEYGHSLQNCIFGPFMLLIVNLPSTVRYWGRRIYSRSGRKPSAAYDSIWFEGQASRWGTEIYNRYFSGHKKPEISN